MKPISLIPYICGAGASNTGAEQAFADVERRGLMNHLRGLGLDVDWVRTLPLEQELYKNLPARGTKERDRIVIDHCVSIRDAVADAVAGGRYPVTLGGDHSMAAGSIAGFAKAKKAQGKIGLIWIDAHADINTPATSPSQSLHGMPVAALLGHGRPEYVAMTGGPVIRPQHVFYIGLRAVDDGEWDFIHDQKIQYRTMEDVHHIGFGQAMAEALKALSGLDHLVLSLDMDAFDPDDAPSVGSPVEDGLKRDEVLAGLASFTPSMLEIAEYNPAMQGTDKTYALLKDVLGAVLKPSLRKPEKLVS